MLRLASLRIGNFTPSLSANASLAHVLSTLIPRITVLFELNWPDCSWYFAISPVQPGENAAGKNASTTFFWPLNSLSLTCGKLNFPFSRLRYEAVKSGAAWPTFTLGGGGGAALGACAMAVAANSTHAPVTSDPVLSQPRCVIEGTP